MKVEVIRCDLCGKIFLPEEVKAEGIAPDKVQNISFFVNKGDSIKCYEFDLCSNCLEKVAETILKMVNNEV